MRLPRTTTRRMMFLVGGMALLFGVTVEIRRTLSQKTRDRIIAEYSRTESRSQLGAQRCEPRRRCSRIWNNCALDLVRAGEFAPEEGQRRARVGNGQPGYHFFGQMGSSP